MKNIKHCISGDELSAETIHNIISLAIEMKNNPFAYSQTLNSKQFAVLFEKPSLRTRFSFSAAINQLGGQVIEAISSERKVELPKDVIRVVQGYCSAIIIRTFDQTILEEMQQHAQIPIINALTDKFHPCQSLADLMALYMKFGNLNQLKVAYIGDGNNILHSLLLLANKVGVTIHVACPENHKPDPAVIDLLPHRDKVIFFTDPKQAVKNCHAVYTDVWTSMGFEEHDEIDFTGYQVNEALMSHALDNAVFMHCMPMTRGKEVSETLPDAPCSIIFEQSENRMHVQKALLCLLDDEWFPRSSHEMTGKHNENAHWIK